ncbi:hypothetical protein [Massilia endophytica]|uniref:hypothetical protein n=1 Tax=Massilia endophytica TaxID=2899220 RepID=UPI001E61838A|nr:hypothetical protein [Massilia endophytica]UGQ47948.1 hypothetical protein LSQ66_05640 [Massilia endophytica]
MNITKHMEAIFIAAALIGAVFSFTTVSQKPLDVAADRAVASVQQTQMPVVTVAAKRLTTAEKARLI